MIISNILYIFEFYNVTNRIFAASASNFMRVISVDVRVTADLELIVTIRASINKS